MTRLVHLALAALPLTLLACDKEEGEDTPADGMPYCDDVSSALDPADAPFGLLGADFVAAVPDHMEGMADFEARENSALSVDIAVDAASLRFVDSVEVYPDTDGPVPDIAVICPDRMELDAQLSISTADGQLAESLDIILVVSDSIEGGAPEMLIELGADLDPDAMGGSLDLADYTDPESFDSVSLSLHASILEGALEGELSAMGEKVDGQTASATMIPVALLSAGLLE